MTRTISWLILLAVTITPSLGLKAADVLISQGATWKYLDDGSDQGTAWRDPAFDDSSWASGPAQLGYGDGDEQTPVASGPSSDKFVTTYFRHTFSSADPANYLSLFLQVLRDDGVVVYLNGVEVFRDNMPGGNINFDTYASTALGAPAENTFIEQAISLANLDQGVNVMAVEIHQANPTSSDISFDLALTATDMPMVTRGPYLQMATPNSIMIRWRTDLPSESWVRFGTDSANLNLTANDATVTTEHAVTLTGLSPDTVYYYELGDGSGWFAGQPNDFFKTPPLPGTAQPTRIWVIGDSGTANAGAESVRNAFLAEAATNPADLWLMLGDNAYSNGTDPEYQAAVFNMYDMILNNLTVWSTRGNHEFDANGNGTTYYNIFSFPTAGEAGGLASGTEEYYSFDYGNIHFLCLDSQGTSRAANGAMAMWATNDLANTMQDWVIAFWHHPPYTKGSHNSDSTSDSSGRLVEMRENILPLLEEFGVDLVLCGHSHSYERSYLLDGHYGNSGTLNESMKLNGGSGREDGDGAYTKATLGTAAHEGTVYIVAGSSGQASGGALNHPAMYISLNQLGSLILDVNGDRLDASFLNNSGNVTDYFTLIKGTGPALPAAPGNLTATPGNQQVSLTWNASAGSDFYNVQRSTTQGGPYQVIASPVTALSYLDDTAANDTTYYYVVTAENSAGESALSNEASATPTSTITSTASSEIPGAGTIGGGLQNTWMTDDSYEQIVERESGGKPSNRYSYLEHTWVFNLPGGNSQTLFIEAFRSDSGEGDTFLFEYSTGANNFTPMFTVSKTSDDNTYQAYVLPGSLTGTVYVRATDADKTPGHSSLDTLFVDHLYVVSDLSGGGTPPGAPAVLTAEAGDQTVTLNWTPSAGATHYIVKRSLSIDGTFSPIDSNVLTTTYEDTGLQNGTPYYYVVAAENSFGVGDDSDVVSATPAIPTIPDPPTSLTASQSGKRKIALTWTQSTSAGVFENAIYRADVSGGPYSLMQIIPAQTSYQDSGLNSGQPYFYRVTALNAQGQSMYSNEATAIPR